MNENLSQAFQLLIFGWGGVFVVLLIIYIACLVLAKVAPIKKENK